MHALQKVFFIIRDEIHMFIYNTIMTSSSVLYSQRNFSFYFSNILAILTKKPLNDKQLSEFSLPHRLKEDRWRSAVL